MDKLLNRMIVLLISTLLTGCIDFDPSVLFPTSPNIKVNPDVIHHDVGFTKYRDIFNEHTGFSSNVNIRFTVQGEYLLGGVIGICLYGKNLIVISRQMIGQPEIIIKWLIFHEMLHCTLGLGHSDDPSSLLYYKYTSESLQRLLYDEKEAINYAIEEGIHEH